MAYTQNKKKNGIGREYRGRKRKDHDQRVQIIVDEAVEDITEKMYQAHKDKVYANHIITAPDVRFDHPDLYRGGPHTPADKIAAVTAFMVTGSSTKASAYCGVPSSTIRQWRKTEWWNALTQQVKKEKNDELDAKLTAILHMATDEIVDRMMDGEYHYDTKKGEVYRMPVSSKTITLMTDRLFDKRQLLRGDVTSRSERVSTDQRLSKLKKEFEKFSNAKEVPGESEVIEDE